MTVKSPLFSIVIPTRNRAHLLPHALQSALNQQFDDYEIIIVANNCQDNTREVVHNLANNRVRYFETNETLTMPDNWEFAWQKARGQYVTYLCDDDALVPSALATIAKEALHDTPPIVSWQDAIYYYPDWNDHSLKNILLLFNFGNQLIEDIPANNQHQQLAHFNFLWSAPIPKLVNCVANRDFFENYRKQIGKLFFPIAPDYSFAWISTQVCEKIRVINRPLSVRGISDHSIGSNAALGAAAKEFFAEFGDFDFFSETVNTLPLSINHLAATFARCNKQMAAKNIPVKPFNTQSLYIALAKQLAECRNLLTDWLSHAQLLKNNVSDQFPALIKQINTILLEPPAVQSTESMRDMHKRIRLMALEYLPNIDIAINHHSGALACGLSSLALKDEILSDKTWSYLYVFGEEIMAHTIYAISTHVDRYYDFLVHCKNKLKVSQ